MSEGDGTGGTEKLLSQGDSLDQLCAAYVKYIEPRANGATWAPRNQECYAEFGTTGAPIEECWIALLHRFQAVLLAGQNDNPMYRTCAFDGGNQFAHTDTRTDQKEAHTYTIAQSLGEAIYTPVCWHDGDPEPPIYVAPDQVWVLVRCGPPKSQHDVDPCQ